MSDKISDGFFTGDTKLEAPSNGIVLYLCNRKACSPLACNSGRCKHTSEEFFAKHKTHPNEKTYFRKDVNGNWWETEILSMPEV